MKEGVSILSSIKRLFGLEEPESTPANVEPPVSRERSTEDLRNTLSDLMHHQMKEDMLRRVAAKPADTDRAQNNMDLGVALTKGKIKNLKRDTMIAMIKAAEQHPTYFVANALRKDSGMAENETQIRDVALLFGVLRKSKTEPAYYGTALSRLRSITKANDLFVLMNTSPEYARSVLRLVLHFTTKFGGPLDMDPALRTMLKKTPEKADDIISYATHRGVGDLEAITYEALTDWQNTTTPLRDGAL